MQVLRAQKFLFIHGILDEGINREQLFNVLGSQWHTAYKQVEWKPFQKGYKGIKQLKNNVIGLLGYWV